MRRLLFVCLPIFVLTSLVAGCSSTQKTSQLEGTEGQLVESAVELVEDGYYLEAIEELEAIEVRFPFGQYNEIVKLNLIYSGVRTEQYPLAINKANTFVKQFRQSPNMDYVLYLRGVALYYQDYTVSRRYLTRNDDDQDLASFKLAYRDFSSLISMYPESDYIPDAKARMVDIRNALAKREQNTASFYLKRGGYVAAIEQAGKVLNEYPNSPAIAEALAVKVKAYEMLGMTSLQEEYYALLTTNFPNYQNIDSENKTVDLDTPQDHVDWLSLVTFGLL